MSEKTKSAPQRWGAAWVMFYCLSWLLPNHYQPWTAFHADSWCAIASIILALILVIKKNNTQKWFASDILAGILLAVLLIQYSTGLINSSGQAWISFAYLLGLILALHTGQAWGSLSKLQLGHALFSAILIASIGSVSLQLQTWLGLMDTGIFDIWSMGLSGDRPYANLGQPNQLGTLLLWGLVACSSLYLSQAIRGPVTMLLAAFILLGIALTQSRTAWIGLSLLLAGSWYWRHLWPSKWVPWCVTGLWLCFWLYFPLLEATPQFLLLDSGADYIREQMQGDLRLDAWHLFLHAALKSPWFGYGWTEISQAQLAVAADLPGLGVTFGHSHNLFLDLVLWLGIPLGLFVSIALIAWFIKAFRLISTPQDALLLMCLTVIGNHAMLELPLHYAYFLLPTGLMVGILNHRLNIWPVCRSPRWVLWSAWLAGALLLGLIIRDYFKVEESFRQVRFELARIGTQPIGQAPDVLLLTQLRDRISFMRYEVKPGMTPQELQWLSDVATAYPGGGIAYKVAKAYALNNQADQATHWLKLVCKITNADECGLIKRVWKQESQGNPLIAAVPWPD